MTNPETALALVQGAFSESPLAAERQLALIGHEHGDEALALITKELTPAEVFALAKNVDSTKSSITQAFVSPDQLREAFSFFGSRYSGSTTEVSRDLLDFLHPFFFEGTREHRESMVTGFLKHDLSMQALCALCVGHPGFIEFFSTLGTQTTGAEGWQEVILFVREVNPKAFNRIRERVLQMVKDEQVEDLTAADTFCNRLCLKLIAEAKRVTGEQSSEGDKPPEVLVDI